MAARASVKSRDGSRMEAEIKVREHDVAVSTKEDVLGLEVAVDEAESVEILEGKKYLRRVEADVAKRKAVARAAEKE